MATQTIRIEGLRELGEKMRKLKREVATKIASQATGAAAAPVKKRAKANILASPSVQTRSLYESVITKKVPRAQTKLTSEHMVTVRRGRSKRKTKGKQSVAPHAIFIEHGTVKMPAEPFLNPALDSEKTNAVNRMVDKLKSGIEKASQ